METFVDIISDIGAQISKIKRCRVNQQTLINEMPFCKKEQIKNQKEAFNWIGKFLYFSIIFVMAFTSFSPSHAYDTAHKICIHSNHPRQGFLPLSAGFPIKIFIFVRANTSERQIIKFTDMKNTGVSSTTYLPAKLPFRTISNSLRLMRITI